MTPEEKKELLEAIKEIAKKDGILNPPPDFLYKKATKVTGKLSGSLSEPNYSMQTHQKEKETMGSTKAIIKSEYIKPLEKLMDFEQAQKVEEKKKVVPKPITIEQVPHSHQTLVVINVTAEPSGAYKERAERLATSLNNTETIKADFVSVSDGKIYDGIVWVGNKPGGVDVQAFKDLGFVQVVEISHLNK